MSEIDLILLGGFQARSKSGDLLSFPTRKTEALLAYLAAHPGQRHPRNVVANLLWADHGDEQAKANLRQTLFCLRKALAAVGQEHLLLASDTLAIDPAGISVDVDRLEHLAAGDSSDALTRAASLYRGEFLAGLNLREEEFNDWLMRERGRLHEVAVGAMKRLLEIYAGQGKWTDATGVANRLLALDPLQEDVHRTLMRIHLGRGDRVQALKQYETCREVLLRNFSIEPEEETRRLKEAARTGTLHEQETGGRPRPKRGLGGARALKASFALAVMALMLALGAAVWQGRAPTQETQASGSEAPAPAYPMPTARVGTALVVLPFRSLDPSDASHFFAEAMTDGVIMELSRFHDLLVIARQTSQRYETWPQDVIAIGRELKVQYALQGSIQKIGEQMRVTVQLVDTGNGQTYWGDRYERPLIDTFEVQDKVTRQIAASLGAISGVVKRSELARRGSVTAEHLEAYGHFLKGLKHIERLTPQDVAIGKEHMRKAIELDPGFAKPYAKMAIASWLDWAMGVAGRDEAFAAMRHYAEAAISIDSSEPWAYWALAYVYLHGERQFEEALSAFEKSLELNPNDADVLSEYGWALAFAGRAQEGIARMREAIRLNPYHPDWYLNNLSVGYLVAKDYEHVASTLAKMSSRSVSEHMYLAASHARLGRLREAREDVAAALKARPDFKLGPWLETRPFARPQDRDYFAEGLRLAGAPE